MNFVFEISFDNTLAKMHEITTSKDVVGALRDLEDQNRNRHPQSNTEAMRDIRRVLCSLRQMAQQISQDSVLSMEPEGRYRLHTDANTYSRYYNNIRRILYDINYNSLLPIQKVAINEFLQELNLLAASNP